MTIPGRASGFSYTIGSTVERRIIQVEVSPESHHVREVQGANFHTNHYLDLAGVDQIIGPSSRVREERGRTLLQDNAPSDAVGVLTVLGDRADKRYPIYREAVPPDGAMTYCTALFDLDAGQLRLYTAHPTEKPEEYMSLTM